MMLLGKFHTFKKIVAKKDEVNNKRGLNLVKLIKLDMRNYLRRVSHSPTGN